MDELSRRELMQGIALGIAGASQGLGGSVEAARTPEIGERPRQAEGVTVLNPRIRVPVSLIIDDSTCLVNLAHFAIPQFKEVFPESYRQPWKTLPREIPDSFVRQFAEWCHLHGVKGKYSLIPYPACVGWLDRFLPGWSKRELEQSLELVRTLLPADWDFHPEGISHTWVINTKTGRPYSERSARFLENLRWSDRKSVDQLTDYFSYPLRILKNVGIRCNGITMPGTFGSRVKPELAQAVLQSCRDIFQVEIPHYFLDGFTDDRSVAPQVYYASGLDGPDPRCVVSILSCTDDWFGGWDGLKPGSVDKCIAADLKGGRLPEVIGRGEPAILLCHWPGMYYNGEEIGFKIFKEIVRRLDSAFDNLLWMKLSEITRYWAAKELTRIERSGSKIIFHAPFACPDFTLRITSRSILKPQVSGKGVLSPLRRATSPSHLDSGSWYPSGKAIVMCLDIPKGKSQINLVAE